MAEDNDNEWFLQLSDYTKLKNRRLELLPDTCFWKTRLQELVQREKNQQLSYQLTGESGPDHDKRFTVEVRLNSNVIGKGTAHSKKQAEQDAAKQALELMGENV